MDTRFWGPSGWRLLHSISFAYTPKTDKSAMKDLFEHLPFVLPCKFCRTSLQEYMEEDPISPALESRESLTRWIWRIHNRVNAKLREQSLAVEADPSFESVERFYKDILARGCSRTDFPGWDFLFSVADLHPESRAARSSVPISGKVPCTELVTLEEKNKRNCLTPEERLPLYEIFWYTIGKTLPFKEWRKSWSVHSHITGKTLDSKESTMKWLWGLRCAMERDLELLNSCKYSSLCKNLKTHRSGCSSSRKARTCRKRKDK
jgi:hypothetical protein